MTDKVKDSTTIQPLVRKDTIKVIELLENNKEELLDLWVDVVRRDFSQPESTSDHQIANHMLYVIDALIKEFRHFASNASRTKSMKQGDMLYDEGAMHDDKDAGDVHGRQRAGINAYNADKVFWEYVILRKIIVQFLQKHRQLDIDHMEIIVCVFENCSRDSLATFNKSLQTVQSKLLSTIVHDIRTPLNTISLMGEYLAMASSSDESAAYANKVVTISSRIGLMLEDMLLTLSAEAGQGLELKFRGQDTHKFLSTAILESQAIYGSRLKFNAPPVIGNAVFDDEMTKRVLENVISNAFKYGDKTSDVTLTAVETETSLRLDIHNHGKPIDTNRQQEIFQFYKHFEGQEDLDKKSWGIGLAFVKAVMNGHQGHVSVTSDATNGTRFVVEFPKKALKEGDSITVSI